MTDVVSLATAPEWDDVMRGAGFMYDMGRRLKSLFAGPERTDRLAGEDARLLELLDLNLLRREAREADIAAGRVAVRQRSSRQLDAARVWRELARRTGDPAALRRAVSAADTAYKGFEQERGGQLSCIEARCEQAAAAMLGAELFARDGLNGAAQFLLKEAGRQAPQARAALLLLRGREQMSSADLPTALGLARDLDAPIAALEAGGRLEAEVLRCERADLLTGMGARLREPLLFDMALIDLRAAGHDLDPAYRPLTWLRVQELRGAALAGLGEARMDVGPVIDAIELLAKARDQFPPGHSPLDEARLQGVFGAALAALGDAEGCFATLDRAIEALDRALALLDAAPMLALRASISQQRAACLVRRAELADDSEGLSQAEAAFRAELVRLNTRFDPIAWAVLQLNLARIYLARARVNGADRGEHGRACEALSAALEVFGDHGLRSLSDETLRELERAREGAPA